jgi:hypothetical protein
MRLEQLLKNVARRAGVPYETVLKDYASRARRMAVVGQPV